jgi:hypothetical protein
MSLQTIINKAESIQFDRRKVVGVQYTRSELPKTTETVTKNPWRMSVTVSAMFPYADYRSLFETIDNMDRNTTETVSFSSIPWIAAYDNANQMSSAQVSALLISGVGTKSFTLSNLPSTLVYPSTKALFKKGDFIQVAGKPHPFTVTADVLRGSGSTVVVPVHRPTGILTGTLTGLGITVGKDVQFKVFCPNMPTYTLIAGKYAQFNDSFQLYEDLGTA